MVKFSVGTPGCSYPTRGFLQPSPSWGGFALIWALTLAIILQIYTLLGCSFGDLVSRLSNWPYRAYYGLLFGLMWDTKWTY